MSKVKNLAYIGLMSAIMCILSPITIPLGGGVGITLGIFVILFMTYVIGMGRALVCYGIYLLLGAVGLPVFAGFHGGIGTLLGPSGGFLVGYVAVIVCVGLMLKIKENRLFLVLGSMIGLLMCYILGCFWYMHVMKVDFVGALWMCVIPFVAFDGIKVALVCVIGPPCKKRVK